MSVRDAASAAGMVAAVLTTALMLPAAAGAATAGSGTPGSAQSSDPGSERVGRRLSDETRFTRWAHVARSRPIYRRPSGSAARVGRLHWYTEDGFSEIYLVLRTHWDRLGREWVKLRIPARPNGQTGWVRRSSLRAFHLTHTLVVVNRKRLRMFFYSNGRRVWHAPVGIGKPASPTPAGRFWIRERFKIADRRSGYYPYAFGTADYSTLSEWPGGGVVGIHGPYYASQAIPGRISHGCIRLKVRDVFWLAAHVGLGTPVHVI
jgi:hypothetical protein